MEEVSLKDRPYDINVREVNDYLLKAMTSTGGQSIIGYYLKAYGILVNKDLKSSMLKDILNSFTWAETSDEKYWVHRYYHPEDLSEDDLKAIQTAYERDFFFIVPSKQLEGIEEAFL